MQLHAISVVDEQVFLLRGGEQTFVVQEARVAHRLVHVELVDDVQGPWINKGAKQEKGQR